MGFLSDITGGLFGGGGSSSSTPTSTTTTSSRLDPALQFGQTAENLNASPTTLDLESLYPGLQGLTPGTSATISSNLAGTASPGTQTLASLLSSQTAPSAMSPNPVDSGIMTSVDAGIGDASGGTY